ncbi:class I SAM-dependent methyltransferase [Marinobacterium sp. YM272]|uniref:class I SAM-dependent methyltransferase n=1 Tax=Marinobacterium sp. YM272 TaxID=3421654 RepID=UPI003D7FA646
MPERTIAHYHQHAKHYQAQYNSVPAEEVHGDWAHLLAGRTQGQALDVGAGSGRDALWLSTLGWAVTAAEPAQRLRELGEQATGKRVRWVDARLPSLSSLAGPSGGYDLIILSAVWMHLPASERPLALQRLSRLLANTGLLIITLRFGPSDPARPMFPVSTAELNALARDTGLQMQLINTQASHDRLKRADVSWQTALLQHQTEPQA